LLQGDRTVKTNERCAAIASTLPTVAILCVTHGRRDLLLQCIKSCVTQDYPNKEIVILFNPDDPETEKVVVDRYPNVRVMRTDRNIGFFPALNLALRETTTSYVMIVDDDARFLSDNALSILIGAFDREPELGAVTCTLEGPAETSSSTFDRYISVFTTGFTMIPRQAFTEWVGYFPELFFRSAGETFLCTELWEQRRPVKRLANVKMFHTLAQQGRSVRDWRFYGLRSQLLCAVMREPALWLGPVLMSKCVKSFGQYLGHGQLGLWMKAWFSFAFNIPEALRLRRPISSATRSFLRQLDRFTIRNLDQSPEWRELRLRRSTD
jgi:GT2 family glycosyltransferase